MCHLGRNLPDVFSSRAARTQVWVTYVWKQDVGTTQSGHRHPDESSIDGLTRRRCTYCEHKTVHSDLSPRGKEDAIQTALTTGLHFPWSHWDRHFLNHWTCRASYFTPKHHKRLVLTRCGPKRDVRTRHPIKTTNLNLLRLQVVSAGFILRLL